MMTSFLVRETLCLAKENGSKAYVCYLDIRKAFDQVWQGNTEDTAKFIYSYGKLF